MKSLRRRIKEAIPIVQPMVEDMLEVKLGDVKVLPFTRFLRDVPVFSKHPIKTRFVYLPITLLVEGFMADAKAGNSAIYYSRSPLARLLSNPIKAQCNTAHELAHIAHSRLCELPIYSAGWMKLPTDLKEGFAEYVGREISNSLGLGTYENRNSRALRAYEKEVTDFRKSLEAVGVSDSRGLVSFIRERTKEIISPK